MSRFKKSLFRNRFAQRIFILFVLSAVLPLVCVAWLSYDHISGQLREHSFEQSRQTSKTIGMELFRRLTMMRTELDRVANSLRARSSLNNEDDLQIDRLQFPGLESLGILGTSGEKIHLFGPVANYRPVLTQEQKQQLTLGKDILYTHKTSDNAFDVMLMRPIDWNDPSRGILVGTLPAESLWSLESLLPGSTHLFILNPVTDDLYGTSTQARKVSDILKPAIAESISGNVEWANDGTTSLLSYWSVFTNASFSVPYLVVAASQNENDVLASLKSFRTIYVPILVLVLLVISLVAANQISRRLRPLSILQDATGRIADGDFTGQIHIEGDDEFAQLGVSFNSMAQRLEMQFTSLATMSEIDRLILSSFDRRYIINTVLMHIGELTPCEVGAVIEFHADRPGKGQISVRLNSPESGVVENPVCITDDEVARLVECQVALDINDTGKYPSYTEALYQDNVTSSLVLFPILIKQRLTGVIIFGYRAGYSPDAESRVQLRKFADHVAVAFSNALWEERLYRQAHYDTLTNLPNRALLKDRLEQAITRAQRNQSYVGVVFIDLDRFKLVNDSLGHTCGDLLLQKIAQQLTDSMRSMDTVVRFGGDEFVVILPEIDHDDNVVAELNGVAEKILAAIHREFVLGHQKLRMEASIGIALYPMDGKTADELIKNADTAMYHAKDQGRGRYKFFAPELNAVALHRLDMERGLRDALQNDEFSLHYQPKVDALTGNLVGVEALIRWFHPEKGCISPVEFIGLAEETGLILKIGEWVLRTACHQAKEWLDAGYSPVRMAVNVSPRQFAEDDFLSRIAVVLQETGLEPAMLELEVTETLVMEDSRHVIEKLKHLHDMGIYLSIDDFGTGYSSLAYLRMLPVHALKIDRTFIVDMLGDQNAQAIVSSTIFMAHQLGFDVVAEGVETQAQKEMLAGWQCDHLQGYLISKPLTANRFAQLLEDYLSDYAAVDRALSDSAGTL